ncbi:MAG TPA: hypothetical protein VMI11_00735 [Actinomycetes bacterium]|nr:hypothetical protein [Actinomycetes bacterium]
MGSDNTYPPKLDLQVPRLRRQWAGRARAEGFTVEPGQEVDVVIGVKLTGHDATIGGITVYFTWEGEALSYDPRLSFVVGTPTPV